MDIPTKPLTIVGLKIENVKKIKAIRISPDPNYVELGGRNAQGKSTVLDSIAYALGGERLVPEKPIRDGEDSGKVTVELPGEITVERSWTRKGSYLVLTVAGTKQRSPQAILDELCGKLTFDPLAFARMDKHQHAATLIDLLGIGPKLTEIDAKIESAFTNRTDWNKEVDKLTALIVAGGGSNGGNVPTEPVSMTALMVQLDEAHKKNSEHAQQRTELGILRDKEQSARLAVEQAKKDIEEAEKLLLHKRGLLSTWEISLASASRAVSEAADAVKDLDDVDTAEISRRLKTVEETNALIKAAAARREHKAQLKEAEEQAQKHTEYIEQLRKDREKVIKDAKYPIAGLGFSSDGVVFNNNPFEQASQAEQMCVSMAIAMKLNPTLRILLVKDGSLLDSDTLNQIRKAVKLDGYQLWIERVGDDGAPGTLVIEDGEIAAVMPTEPAEREEVKAGLKKRRAK